MNKHEFSSTFEAYDNTQWNEELKTGDIIIIKSEKVVGVVDTWPIAVTVEFGELHSPNHTITLEGFLEAMEANCSQFKQDVDFKESFKEAVNVANELNFKVSNFFK